MSTSSLKASIVIPTYNGIRTIEACLDKIFGQTTPWDFDVHVIDSGSTDGTLEIVSRFPVKLDQIPNHEFGHGKTRSYGASCTNGEYIVFLVQDAEPVTSEWLITLIDAVETAGAAGAFGRQVPRPNASLFTRRAMANALPHGNLPVVKRMDRDYEWSQLSPRQRYELAFFHDANSCIRREVLLQIPYRDVSYGEDLDWAKRVLIAGHTIVYEPRAEVVHSHDRSPAYEFRRAYADHCLARQLFELGLVDSLRSLTRVWIWDSLDCLNWIWRLQAPISSKLGGTAHSLVHIAAMNLGSYFGSNSQAWQMKFPPLKRIDKNLRRGI